MTLPNPPCCTLPQRHWPLPRVLGGAILISCRFDPALLAADDFVRSAIEPPPSIQRSVAKRQAEFLAGRLCARAALHCLGVPASVPGIGADRAPQWPDGICGAITHGAGWAGVVVARRSHWQGLGMDAETLIEPARALHLHEQILTPNERQRMAWHGASQVSLIVTLTFSLKESLFKALYPLVLKRFYFEHAEVIHWHPDGSARLRLLIDLSEQWQAGAEFDGQFQLDGERLLSLVHIPL